MTLLYEFLDDVMLSILSEPFDDAFYLKHNPDVANTKHNPLYHYLEYGWNESRTALPEPLLLKLTKPTEQSTGLVELCQSAFNHYVAQKLKLSDRVFDLLLDVVEKGVDLQLYRQTLPFDIPQDLVLYHLVFNTDESNDSPALVFVKSLTQQLSQCSDQTEQMEYLDAYLQTKIDSCIDGGMYQDGHLVIYGWYASKQPITEIVLVNERKGTRVHAKGKLLCPREDINALYPNSYSERYGFLARFEIKDQRSMAALLTEPTSFSLLLNTTFSFCQQSVGIQLEKLGREQLSCLLERWNVNAPGHRDSVSSFYRPLLNEIFQVGAPVNAKLHEFGQEVSEPLASIIIPLYGRCDFIRYQMSNFCRYKTTKSAEIIYVVDDPDLVNESLALSNRVFQVTQTPFKILTLDRNVGFASANNLAVKYARSNNLILMNSDVLPANGEWLTGMLDYLNNVTDLGLLGVRLLFEDGGIQHDGMVPKQSTTYPDLILNDHPYKGWPVSLVPTKAEFAPCELVTAACVAVKKEVFESVEGFDEHYYLGDFEDSDLCKKLIANGKQNYIARDISLYHLERQSQNLVTTDDWKHKLTLMNALYYSQKWHVSSQHKN